MATRRNYTTIGYQGENRWDTITISIADLVKKYPGGYAYLYVVRAGDDEGYIPRNVEQTENALLWTPDDYDTEYDGILKAQAMYVVNGDVVGKTQIFIFNIDQSLTSFATRPATYEDWVNGLLQAATNVNSEIDAAEATLDGAVEAAQAAQAAAEAAQTAAESAQHTAENAKASAVMSSNAAYNYAADANRAKRDATTAKNDAVQAKGDAELAKTAAETAEDNANTSALQSEGYAVGTQDGVAAGEGEPYFHDNAKYYKELAEAAKTDAIAAKDRAEEVVDGIEDAGDEQVERVTQTGTAQVQAVTAEGTTQVGNVQTKGQQVLASIPADYTDLSENVDDLKSAIAHFEGGTTGQILRKKSGTNFDAEWVNVGQPTDEQTAQAVSEWLDEHPEATTTVEDGSITKVKLNSSLAEEIDGKAHAIYNNTEQSFFHSGLSITKQIEFVGNSLAFDTAKYANRKNLFPDLSVNKTSAGVRVVASGKFAELRSGTATSTTYETIFDDTVQGIEPGSYVLIFKVRVGNSVISNAITPDWRIRIDGTSYQDYVTISTDQDKQFNVTVANANPNFRIRLGMAKDSVYDGLKVWYGLYKSDVTIVDTNELVSSSGIYDYSVNTDETIIDTLQHQSVLLTQVDTKDYIDNHIPDIKTYWTEEIYALPEKFGAYGDGDHDDSIALSDCIAYAKTSNKAIRGYGRYKTSATIILDAQYMDVYLREVIYTGSACAVDIRNQDIKFEFHAISANTSGAIGLNFGKTTGSSVSYARRCRIVGNVISSDGDCIFADRQTIYNTCEIRYLSSANANCIEFSQNSEGGFNAGEYVFRSCSCSCPNGYVVYFAASCKMYDFTVEANCKYGLSRCYDSVCIGWRHREQIDSIARQIVGTSDKTNGALFRLDANNNRFVYITDDPIYWFSIDTTTAGGYGDVSNAETWHAMKLMNYRIKVPVRGSGILPGAGTNVYEMIGKETIIVGGNKVFVPYGRKNVIISSAVYDYKLFDSMAYADILACATMHWGTDFVIDVSHADIYFQASHCAIGYNDLTLTQKNGNTATIYDKRGNVIFDGTNEGDGKWRFRCVMNSESNGRYTGNTSFWGYDGTNEYWEIEKMS